MRRIILAWLLAAGAAPAMAQAPAPPAKAPPPQVDPVTTIVRMDANHDGRITVEELTAYREAHRPK